MQEIPTNRDGGPNLLAMVKAVFRAGEKNPRMEVAQRIQEVFGHAVPFSRVAALASYISHVKNPKARAASQRRSYGSNPRVSVSLFLGKVDLILAILKARFPETYDEQAKLLSDAAAEQDEDVAAGDDH